MVMRKFPREMGFKYKWRPYQIRVLQELEEYLEDNRLHVVAAPGSGKTLLGLEVVHRLNKPTLILAPTLAIRDQWVSRLVRFFLPDGSEEPEWISTNIFEPKFLTVSTYQGLYSACSNRQSNSAEEEEENEEETEWEQQAATNLVGNRERDVIVLLGTAGVKTVVLDEAHHLRANWWRVLTMVVRHLAESTVLALTATPPYDVSIYEWERYLELCGPVDAEVSVPELVLEKNLCPHQDLVLLSYPSPGEERTLDEFAIASAEFIRQIESNGEFLEEVQNHRYLVHTSKHVEEVLENPTFFSSLLVFLRHKRMEIPREAMELISGDHFGLPWYNVDWLETLLEGMLFPKDIPAKDLPKVLKDIRDQLSRINALEYRQVNLRSTRNLNTVLKRSIMKLQSIREIVSLELKSLGMFLRMVILTDFIRKAYLPKFPGDLPELDQLGVAPIFEMIRRSNLEGCKLGILSGSIIIIPADAESLLRECAKSCGIDEKAVSCMPFADPSYLILSFAGSDSHSSVQIITELFSRGGINVLVGTTSLLGEGWDAPSINSLILASFVGSYMLSNQMRGRAIRTNPQAPDKTSNIWHLICVKLSNEEPGEDFETMERRFKAFAGVSFVESMIENGFDRLGIDGPPFEVEQVEATNRMMIERAGNREGLRRAWDEALKRGEAGVRLVEEVTAKKARLPVPRAFVFRNTLTALGWELGFLLGFFVARQAFDYVFPLGDTLLSFISVAPMIGFLLFFIRFLPKLMKAIWLFIKHGPIKSSVRQIGMAIVESMCDVGIILTPLDELEVIVEEEKRGVLFCHIEGGTRRERSTYMEALQEVLGPVESPRYILERKTIFRKSYARLDYHSVPEVLATKREYAETFAKRWKQYVGEMDLIYTRSKEGRIALLRARNHSLSAGFRPRSERVSRWK
ncbi:MAG: DEAD/DEAH box helicase [Candidatus Thorarchaeota archaeon]|nr:DEAD/DEAH box helicase [Candidatus Thorarchaeota archaeon]